jgi:hypothetical protein
VRQASPAALMTSQVDDHAAALVGHGLHGSPELVAAVTALGAKGVTGEAFTVDADQDACPRDTVGPVPQRAR